MRAAIAIALSLGLFGCAPWDGEDLAAVDGRVAYQSVSLGQISCGVATEGELYCWGAAGDMLGTIRPTELCQFVNATGAHDLECTKRPLPVFGDRSYDSVAVGQSHVCAVTRDGEVWCWGDNTRGKLGYSASIERTAGGPRRVDGIGEPVRRVALNDSNTCAVTRSGALWCWGAYTPITAGGGIPFPSLDEGVPPFRIETPSRYVDLALGSFHGCALTDAGRVECWGAAGYNSLGAKDSGPECARSSDLPCLFPVPIDSTARFKALVAAGGSSCAIEDPTGILYCWGDWHPVEPLLSEPVSAVAFVSRGEFCVLDLEGKPRCAGNFIAVDGAHPEWPRFQSIAVSQMAACGVSGGDIYCWGSNFNAQFGNGGDCMDESQAPVKVSNPYKY